MSSSQRPNILIICTDQQNWWMNSFNGHPIVRTPNLERLAGRGANFRRCYSNSPVCVPARASLMSGRYPSDVEAYDNGAPFDGRVPTFANLARDQGYFCTTTGKLDLCSGKDYGMEGDELGHGHDVSPDVTAFFRNPICRKEGMGGPEPSLVREGPPGDRVKMEVTRSFINERSRDLGRPWLAWTGWGAPHNAYRCAQNILDSYPFDQMDLPYFPGDWQDTEHPVMQMTRYHRCCTKPFPEDKVRGYRAAYYGMITEIDGLVGELIASLEETGQIENTVVIFTSDHGDMMGEHGIFQKNAPYDACARVPLLIAGPGLPKGKVVDTPVSLVDLYATIVDLAGGPELDGVRGHSLLPLAHGDASRHPYAYVELNTERLLTGVFSIIQGDWKYNYWVDYPDQLFNLKEDPGEWCDRARDSKCRDVRSLMRELLFQIVDPEKANDEAFADQKRRLDAYIGERSLEGVFQDEKFFRQFSRRMGEEQSRQLLTRRFQTRDRTTAP